MHLAWKGSSAPRVSINGNDVDTTLGTGKLIVRHIENTDEAQDGTNTYALRTDKPTSPVEHAEAMAIKDNNATPKFYTNNDENREVNAEGIQLLDDDLLTYKDEDRTTPMENKVTSILVPQAKARNGITSSTISTLLMRITAILVSANYGTTVYLPYPKGLLRGTRKSLA